MSFFRRSPFKSGIRKNRKFRFCFSVCQVSCYLCITWR
nr:MAG TPA: hypothetical protein [Caudoviricetes sp.]